MKLTNYGKSIVYKLYAFLVYLIPMLILFFVNMKEYTTNSRISFFGIIIIAFVIIAFKETVRKIINYDLFLSVNVAIFVVSLLAYFLAEKLILITAVSFVGCVLSSFVGAIATTYYNLSFIVDANGNKRKDTKPGLTLKQALKETYLSALTKGE